MHQQSSSGLFNRKILVCIVIVALMMISIILRLIYLQIISGTNFLELSQKNYLRTEPITSPRGNILDCKGRLLATNRPVTSVYWKGTGNKTLSQNQRTMLDTIGLITGKSMVTSDAINTIQQAERRVKQIILAEDISLEQLSKIAELYSNHANIYILTHFKRFYPYHNLASHIIGYIHHMNIESMGKMGLEKLLDCTLKGQSGKLLKVINSVGNYISQQELSKALAGNNCTTTIDLDLQLLTENIFNEHERGTMIIMNPKTGALKALVSKPNFNPSVFLNTLSLQAWHQLQEEKPFLNRAFDACYPPASIFKLITMSAALENHIITQETMIYCRGFLRFKGRPYHCSKKEGHGTLSALDALAHSCNIIFFEIAKRLSVDTIAEYAHRFGLGQKTHSMFSEQIGLIPTSEWKMKTKRERWWPGETLSVAIGQSYLLATPIQIACMIASIFEGILIKPRILETESIVKRPLKLLPSTRDFLKQSMKEVTIQGTGIKVGKIRNIDVYAKTGTAQTSALEKRDLGKEYREHAWFVAHFQYKNQEPLVMVIAIENVGSSRVATATAQQFLLAYRTLCEAQERTL